MKRLLKLLTERRVSVRIVRAGEMNDADVQRVLASYGADSGLMRAIGELYARLEDRLIEEAFDGTPEKRLAVLARLEGAQELYRQILSFRQAAEARQKKEHETT